MRQHRHSDHLVLPLPLEADAPDPARCTTDEDSHLIHGKPDGPASSGRQHEIRVRRHLRHPYQRVTGIELHGDLAVHVDRGEIRHPIAADVTRASREHQFGSGFRVSPIRRLRQHGRDLLLAVDAKHVDDWSAARLRRAQRQVVHLPAMNDPVRREEQDRVMGTGREHVGDKVVVLDRHRGAPLAAPALRAVGGQLCTLYVTIPCKRHHHVFALDQVVAVGILITVNDFGSARCPKLIPNLLQLGSKNFQQARSGTKRFQIAVNFLRLVPQFTSDLFPLQAGQSVKLQIQNGLCLTLGKPARAVRRQFAARLGN